MPPKKEKTKEDEAQAKELVVESSSRSLVVVVFGRYIKWLRISMCVAME